MHNFAVTSLNQIAVHNVGNKANNELITFSKGLFKTNDQMVLDLLKKYFLTPFKEEIYYQFQHENDLELNPVFRIASEVFDEPSLLFDKSLELANHLFDQTINTKIKGGEFYVTYLKDIKLDDEYVDGIGLFKSEHKETFIKVYQDHENLEIGYQNGISINKLDKGCIILNTEKDEGYRVCVIDKSSKNGELAVYWKSEFLAVDLREDAFYHTQNYLDMCKNFCEDVFSPENDVERADQALLLNRSMDYFTENEVFNENSFKQQVIQDQGVIGAFEEYKEEYKEKNEVDTFEEFEISPSAIKSQKSRFKSILKLDKNFHIYIHGNQRLIERGTDEESGFKYYKLFFENEL